LLSALRVTKNNTHTHTHKHTHTHTHTNLLSSMRGFIGVL